MVLPACAVVVGVQNFLLPTPPDGVRSIHDTLLRRLVQVVGLANITAHVSIVLCCRLLGVGRGGLTRNCGGLDLQRLLFLGINCGRSEVARVSAVAHDRIEDHAVHLGEKHASRVVRGMPQGTLKVVPGDGRDTERFSV